VAQALGSVSQDAAVAQVNQHLQQTQTDLKLEVDPGSGRTVFQVIQQGTGEVVLQVPSAEVLGMSRRMRDLESQTGASGALVDKEG
jgi:flagellar protein FlaG